MREADEQLYNQQVRHALLVETCRAHGDDPSEILKRIVCRSSFRRSRRSTRRIRLEYSPI
jgi:hypothetical protein